MEQFSKRYIALLNSWVWQHPCCLLTIKFLFGNIFVVCVYIQTSMNALSTMEAANRTAMTRMEVTHAPAMMTTSLTVMDIHVKVPAR